MARPQWKPFDDFLVMESKPVKSTSFSGRKSNKIGVLQVSYIFSK